MDSKVVKTITVIDPDTNAEVQVQILKLSNGAMVGIDESYLANTDEPVYSPYEVGVEINVE